jgi:hypothetical protein
MAKHLQIDNTSAEVKAFVKRLEVDKGEYVLEEAGKPLVGVVPPWQVGKLAQGREDILALLEKSWQRNRTVDQDEIERAVTEVIEEVHREKSSGRP